MVDKERDLMFLLSEFYGKSAAHNKSIDDFSKAFFGAPLSVALFFYAYVREGVIGERADQIYIHYQFFCKDSKFSPESQITLGKYIKKKFNLVGVKEWNQKERKLDTVYRDIEGEA